MKKQISDILKKEWDIPHFKRAEEAIQAFSFTERIIFYGLIGLFAVASLSLLWKVNTSFIVEIPRTGGTLVEGIVGTPRFINPLIAISDADRDLSALIYSGLLKATVEGELVPNLAASYSISPDGKVYTFTLRDDIFFHDGKPVTADDVVFTITKAQDPALKSPKRPNWEGVQVRKVSDTEIELILKQPYAPFLENATIGIIPQHIWKEVDVEQFSFSQYNIEPIGSGPYKISRIRRNAGGIPSTFELVPFKKYALGKAYIENLIIKFYPSQGALLSAYQEGAIQSMNAVSPREASLLKERGVRIESGLLPRVFGVFFNQNQATVLANKEVREALNMAIDKKEMVDKVLSGYGRPIASPIPLGLIEGSAEYADDFSGKEARLEAARKILTDAGWKPNEETGIMEKKVKTETIPLTFSIATSNAAELKQAAELIKGMWSELGASVEIHLYDTSDLNQNVIRTRRYDSLLFGEIVGRDLDFFAFWHSSQRNDPGLNISLYTNIKADKLLEEARSTTDRSKRLENYLDFEKEILKDIPAVFTHSPDFLYLIPSSIQGFSMKQVTVPSERFLDIHEWYIETEKVWNVFVN